MLQKLSALEVYHMRVVYLRSNRMYKYYSGKFVGHISMRFVHPMIQPSFQNLCHNIVELLTGP